MLKKVFGNQRGELLAGAPVRADLWWIEPLMVILLLGSFAVYATWAALQNAHYYVAPYLSPFYSPCLSTTCQHVSLPLIGSWWNLSPAFLVLWIPGGFRATCYYYRKAYYRSFFGLPPGCAVRDVSKSYTGETRFPFILQNIHRYFFWLGIPVIAFLWWDVVLAFNFGGRFGMGVGTLVLFVNSALLSLYTFSCHSCRHICGGSLNRLSTAPARHTMWQVVTALNERHMQIAWVSLIWVGLADVYIRLLSMGYIKDLRIF
ncbi:MAG TPA: succinate dehydrogenase [Methylomirabilota bacterium]|nr:succinate dehydrogenase [Methylomirabilota bacterium]